MKATFFDDNGSSVAYVISDGMSLQDALNATKNTHFAPSLIVIQQGKNTETSDNEQAKAGLNHTSYPVGKHTIQQVMEKHGINADKRLAELLNEGAEHELEHTDDYIVAMGIAIDHLYENLDYYKKLKQVKLAYGGLLKHTVSQEKHSITVSIPRYCGAGPLDSQAINDSLLQVGEAMNKMFGAYSVDEGHTAVNVTATADKQKWDLHKRQLAYQISSWARKWGCTGLDVVHNSNHYFIASHYHDALIELDEIITDDI